MNNHTQRQKWTVVNRAFSRLIAGMAAGILALVLPSQGRAQDLREALGLPISFRFDMVPFPCSTLADCPSHAFWCHQGRCKGWTGQYTYPITINYVAPGTSQGDLGICYDYSKFHTFQTMNAFKVDSLNGGTYVWDRDQLDRSIRLSMSLYYNCCPTCMPDRFAVQVGFIEFCIESMGDPPLESQNATFPPHWHVCGLYDQYRNLVVDSTNVARFSDCSAIQQGSQDVVSYWAWGFEDLIHVTQDWEISVPSFPYPIPVSVGSYEHQVRLAHLLYTQGPLKANVSWPDNIQYDTGGYTACVPPLIGGHEVSIVGYDLSVPTRPAFFIQNSHYDWNEIYKVDLAEWATSCGFATIVGYYTGIRAPTHFPSNPIHPFYSFRTNRDMDLDGAQDFSAAERDTDGDGVLDPWDCNLYNPYLKTDLDQDGHCDDQSRMQYSYKREACSAYCESALMRTGVVFNLAACQDECEDWDRCMTLKHKSGSVPPCAWGCLAEANCPEDQEGWVGCCDLAQLADISLCRHMYQNFTQDDRDDDGIADVCELRPTVSELEFSLSETYRVVRREGAHGFSIFERCRVTVADVSFWLFGGTSWTETSWWEDDNEAANEMVGRTPLPQLVDIGACGCTTAGTNGWGCNLPCPPASELVGSTWAWDPIASTACQGYDIVAGGAPTSPDLCMDRYLRFSQDEICGDGDCDFHQHAWFWWEHVDQDDTGTPLSLVNNYTKVKVGWRRDWDPDLASNTLTLSTATTYMPPFTDCQPVAINTDNSFFRYVDIQEIPRDMGPRAPFSALGLMHQETTGDLHVLGFGRGMRGPVSVQKAAYPAGPAEGIRPGTYVTALARLSPTSWGERGAPESALFVMEPGRQVPGGEFPGGPARVWVGLLSRPGMPFYLASDLFRSGLPFPVDFADPRIAYDPLRGRLLVAGGGERGEAAVWALSPKDGTWFEVTRDLPDQLVGFDLAVDAVGKRLFITGGSGGAAAASETYVMSLGTDRIQAAPVSAPPELARTGHGSIVDPVLRKLYVYGGERGGQVLADLWAMDLDSFEWELLDAGGGPGGPAPKSRPNLVLEPRFGRLYVAGGTDATGLADPGRWVFGTHTRIWQEDPVAEATDSRMAGTISWDRPASFELVADPTVPYPGEPTLATLRSPEPCLGVRVSDSRGRPMTAALSCRGQDRHAAFMGQPGERYYLDVIPLAGFDRERLARYELVVSPGQVAEVLQLQLPSRPVALDVATRPEQSVLLVQTGNHLRLYDLDDPQSPVFLSEQRTRRFSRDMEVAGGAALVARMGRGNDLILVDTREPAAPLISSGVSFPGPGRRVTSWGGTAYAAGVTRVYAVRLGGAGAPEVLGHVSPGGVVTAVKAHAGRLLVASGGVLSLYDIGDPGQPQLLSDAPLEAVGAAIAVVGDTVHVAEMTFGRWIVCMLGLPCSRQGPAEVYSVRAGGELHRVGSYQAGAASLPYLRWSGRHAYAIEGAGLVGLRIDPVGP